MKGSETKLIKYMEGADKRFVIPVYQRNYDWKIENCKQLYDDLVKVVRNNRKNHFFGSIVSTYNPDGDNEEYQIIDGQQRLTTVSLLLLAMYNLIRQGKVLPADNRLSDRIYLDPTNLVFYLRDDDGTEEDEQIAGTRHEVRKKFWTYALDLIKEANAESGAFSNCNPVKENWVNGYFGIQGFNLCCVGNFDSARVEVYFGKADNDENKKAYDLVAGHKTEIERALGEELIWDRGDDKKSSKIYYMIDGVGIDNEADWPVIAKFHAKWTVKLYEAIVVPYLKPVYLEAPAPASSETKTSSNNTIEIKKIGITDLDTDAIVNAANDGLWAGSGVCGAIFKAAGRDKLQAACNEIGHCDTGSAVITPGFDLKAKYIIHAVGPVWNGGDHNEPQQLYGAYRKSLELALENGCHSVGFPLISAGIFGYPKDKAWRKAIQACTDFFEKHPEADLKVIFAVLDDDILTLGKNTVDEIAVKYKA